MKPPYDITTVILNYVSSISEKLGEVKAYYLDKPSPRLRKQNKIKTIHSSLKIEGNTLSEDQITAILEDRIVIGPQKDISEVVNAISVYDIIDTFSPFSVRSFKKAHKLLMNGLLDDAGLFRKKGVGIMHGNKLAHVAPPAANVPFLMKNLFDYLKNDNDPLLIESCVFHYETEFIHPFSDGNGRMGRLWQTVILMKEYPVFEYLPFESLISKTQEKYYNALVKSDSLGSSTPFIEYMLKVIDNSLSELLQFRGRKLTMNERLQYIIDAGLDDFSRKDYMDIFKNISSATASRDLKTGIKMGLFTASGEKNKTKYKLKRK